MPKYIALMNWTDKGIKAAKDSPARADKARKLAKKMGGEFQQLFMTMGAYDLVAVFDMPSDEAMAKFSLTVATEGNVRSTALKAFDEASYRKIIGAL